MEPYNTPTTFRLYIGLNDRHGRAVDRAALEDAFDILDHAHPCYTRTDAVGRWEGQSEPTAVVDVVAPDTAENRERFRATARTLARILDQDCIGLAVQPLALFSLESGEPREDR